MGFAVVNVLGFQSLNIFWPLYFIYGAVVLAVAIQASATKRRPVLLVAATTLGLCAGSFLGRSVAGPHAADRSHDSSPLEQLVTQAAERVDQHKERLAKYIDENLPDIPEVLHANCRELQDALANRGLLCVDVGPEAPGDYEDGPGDPHGYRLWAAYEAAKADLDQLVWAAAR